MDVIHKENDKADIQYTYLGAPAVIQYTYPGTSAVVQYTCIYLGVPAVIQYTYLDTPAVGTERQYHRPTGQ